MSGGRTRHWVGEVLCWGCGILFIWSGWVKVMDPEAFAKGIRGFRILGDPYAAWLALVLPWLEIFSGLAVFTGWLRRGGLLVLNVALLVFIGVLASAWVRGLDVNCGCFGKASAEVTVVEGLLRNVLLIALGGYLWFAEKGAQLGSGGASDSGSSAAASGGAA